jgi:hypothetical protein
MDSQSPRQEGGKERRGGERESFVRIASELKIEENRKD